MRLFVDGLLVDEVLTAGAPIRDSGNRELFIGTFRTESPLTAWHGTIDEVRIWDVARSQGEIRRDARRALSGLEEGLVAYYHFDEGAGRSAFDHSPKLNDGLLGGGDPTGSPTWTAESEPQFESPLACPEQGADHPLTLDGFDADGAPLSATITSLPHHGRLFQTTDGVTPESEITGSGQSLAFDNTDQALFLPHGLIDTRSSLTIQWAMRSDGSNGCFFSGARSAQNNAFILCNRGGGRIDLWEEGTNAASWFFDLAGHWHTFALVRDQPGGTAELFADGASLGVRSIALSAINIDAGGFVIGQEQDSVGGGFQRFDAFGGELDDLRFWDRPSTPPRLPQTISSNWLATRPV